MFGWLKKKNSGPDYSAIDSKKRPKHYFGKENFKSYCFYHQSSEARIFHQT